MSIERAYSYTDIERKQFNEFDLDGEWKRHLGSPERAGSILIYGDSGHGKTAYALQMMKMFCAFEKVHYNSAEEGMRASFKRNLKLNNLKPVASKYNFQSEGYDAMVARLKRKRQPKIIIPDSVQYIFRGKRDTAYFDLLKMFPDTLFIWISHMQKGAPKGAIADAIKWDAQTVIHVQDFKAYVEKSRCGGDELTPYVISKEKAEERELKLLKKG